MANSFEQAAVANRQATAALAAKNRAKEQAGTVTPGRDVHAETAARVKRGGPWVASDPDSTYAQASGTSRKT